MILLTSVLFWPVLVPGSAIAAPGNSQHVLRRPPYPYPYPYPYPAIEYGLFLPFLSR